MQNRPLAVALPAELKQGLLAFAGEQKLDPQIVIQQAVFEMSGSHPRKKDIPVMENLSGMTVFVADMTILLLDVWSRRMNMNPSKLTAYAVKAVLENGYLAPMDRVRIGITTSIGVKHMLLQFAAQHHTDASLLVERAVYAANGVDLTDDDVEEPKGETDTFQVMVTCGVANLLNLWMELTGLTKTKLVNYALKKTLLNNAEII